MEECRKSVSKTRDHSLGRSSRLDSNDIHERLFSHKIKNQRPQNVHISTFDVSKEKSRSTYLKSPKLSADEIT